MNWLALNLAQVAALWTAAAAVAVALYLLHQRPRHKFVSTLRFWQSLEASAQPRRRWQIREPLALLAQLLFLLLVILALANPRRGGAAGEPRYVALLVDTSVWAQTRPPGETPWMERIRQEAGRVLDRLPPGDRVLLMRAEADATPAVPFTEDREALRRALAGLQPSDTVADLPRALEAGRAALAGRRRAALVYVGPGMVDETQARRLDDFARAVDREDAARRPQLLVRLVGNGGPVTNYGITRLALRRDPAQPDRWHLLAQVRNYSPGSVAARLSLSAASRPLQEQSLLLDGVSTTNARAEFNWAEGGLLVAELSPADALAADNRAYAYLPPFRVVRIAVYTADPQAYRPVLAAHPYLRAEFVPPASKPSTTPDLAIYDGVAPPSQSQMNFPERNTIVFLSGSGSVAGRSGQAPDGQSSARASRGAPQSQGRPGQARLTGWNPQHPVTRWIRTRDISVRSVAPLAARPSDTVLASADGAPAVLAREEAGRKTLLFGFDVRQSNFPLQPAFPLLLAAAIEWMTGAVQETADPVATGEARLVPPSGASRVFSPAGAELPFARSEDELHLLALQAGVYRVAGTGGERRIAFNIPPLPAQRWKAGAAEKARLEASPLEDTGRDLWRWLVLLSLIPLWVEWRLFHRSPRNSVENRRGA